MPAPTTVLPLAKIRVGQRHRKALGDLDALCASMQEVGQLQPIAISPDYQLLAGQRRLEAAKLLKWKTIKVCVVSGLDDALLRLKAERDENCCRLAFRVSEAVALGQRLEVLEAKAAKSRQGRAGQVRSGKLPEHSTGQTRDRVGRAVGLSGRSFEKAKQVLDASKRDPQRYGPLAKEMDRTGRIDRAFKVFQSLRHQEECALDLAGQIKGTLGIHTGDFRRIGKRVADNSVSLLLTDPPYSSEGLPLFEALGRFAARVLRPSGLLLSYSGHFHLPKVLAALGSQLDYVHCFALAHTDRCQRIIEAINICAAWKPLLLYQKPPRRVTWTTLRDKIDGERSKRHHEWEQGLSEALHFVKHLSPEGGLVVDCMCGSATTGVACLRLGRQFIGMEIDAAIAKRARARLNEEVPTS